MGKSKVDVAFKKLSKELPPATKMGWDENWMYKDMALKVFEDDKDRDQFIHALIAVITDNGLIDLEDHDLRLMYSRRAENQDRIVARVVAIQNGIIKAKVEPETDGKDQGEAIKAFKRDVEVKLDRILQSIPSSSTPSTQTGTRTANMGPQDVPPAYSSTGFVGIMDEKRS